jgi:hypothetical protein
MEKTKERKIYKLKVKKQRQKASNWEEWACVVKEVKVLKGPHSQQVTTYSRKSVSKQENTRPQQCFRVHTKL